MTPEERDRLVLRLYDNLLDIEQRLIPTGLHVFGRPPGDAEAADMLRMVASFDRPEFGVRSLPGLVARGLGLPAYEVLLAESGSSEYRLAQRERVEAVVRLAIERFLTGGGEGAARLLAGEANVPVDESLAIFRLLGTIREQLRENGELDALVRAMNGEYIEPGPGADIVQNPGILPTGRNTHAVNPYGIPSAVAFRRAEAVTASLLNRFLQERGRYPEAIGMVLWGMDNIKTQGEGVAQALRLIGVEPRRDGMNRVSDIEVVPLDRLGRPRIDVVMTVSGIFRDLFAQTMELLDRAVRKVAAMDEPPEMNFVRKHAEAGAREDLAFDDAAARVFSNSPGSYGTNVDVMVADGQWDGADEIGKLFVTRKCFAYGRSLEGREARALMESALSRVEVTYQNVDSAEVGITDVDHYFEYLGGLTKAVQNRTGERPDVYLSDSLAPLGKVRSLEELVRLETRTKTLNPKWYEGMLKHGFRGVAEIERRVANTFGWSATAGAVDDWIYDEIASTYFLDEAMFERLRSLNVHSARSLAARLIEAEGRGFWAADEAVSQRLRSLFADLEDQLEGLAR
ncbi:MAG: cobaltochelatase subunit CobN [Bryobacteraceae bacterium]|nr:cobaltochelatase subunit CobN [Bryobacteraceae bacterium]